MYSTEECGWDDPLYSHEGSFKRLSFPYVLCTVKTTHAVNIHSTCYENHRSLTIMVIRIELRNQTVPLASFGLQNSGIQKL